MIAHTRMKSNAGTDGATIASMAAMPGITLDAVEVAMVKECFENLQAITTSLSNTIIDVAEYGVGANLCAEFMAVCNNLALEAIDLLVAVFGNQLEVGEDKSHPPEG